MPPYDAQRAPAVAVVSHSTRKGRFVSSTAPGAQVKVGTSDNVRYATLRRVGYPSEAPGPGRKLRPMKIKRLEGLWFDDLEPGNQVESPRRTITEADIVNFACLSGDFNPLHTDEPSARRTPFRGRIAHGLLVQSIGSGLVNQTGAFHGTIAALAEMRISYLAPVRAGDTIGVVLTVREKDPNPNKRRGWVLFDCVVTNQDGVPVIEGEWRTLHLRARKDR